MKERIEAMLAELQQEIKQAQQQEAQARMVRLRLEGAVSVLQLLLQDDQNSPQPSGQEGVTNGRNN